ncbi:MAG: hypothetical protein IJ119_15885 [Clostridia bacterium]|nr:hypothetical protein [Clostridia bacterium]
MTLFEAVADRVTAKQAAEFYGMEFGRNGRARCIWHDDHRPDLAFYGDHCTCHACHNGGDSIALTAQLFKLTMLDAAKKLNADYRLGLDVDAPTTADNFSEVQRRRQEDQARRAEFNRQWAYLCDVVHEADQRLSRFPAEDSTWDNPEFLNTLKARTLADQRLETLKLDGVDAI